MSSTNQLGTMSQSATALGFAKRKHTWGKALPCSPLRQHSQRVRHCLRLGDAEEHLFANGWHRPSKARTQCTDPHTPALAERRSTLDASPQLSQLHNGARCVERKPFNVTHRQVRIRFRVFGSERRRKWRRGSKMEKVCEIQRTDECVCDHVCGEIVPFV